MTDSEKLLAARSSPPSIQAVHEERECVVDALVANVNRTMKVRADMRHSIFFSFLRIRVRRILSPLEPFDDHQPSSTPFVDSSDTDSSSFYSYYKASILSNENNEDKVKKQDGR
ncbi:hypothetical protein PIB30_036792 [Stylosanthes scabra]|uniref:Uncharacterized protein n=1 Tax=Stylosanthes scabra TaxID=79078 RepID=A0ABU6YDV6_9FABA|nr:hypothetical protein [Stylosanthes scabra]